MIKTATKATKTGTSIYFEERPKIAHKTLADTGLVVSQAGFGTYRIEKNSDHKDALIQALEKGVNLIDTSSNYGNGDSERCIGEALLDCFTRQTVRREQVVIVTKAGYIQGDLYQESQSRKKNNASFLELVEFDNELEHCIHPEFLANQITDSLDRLNVDSVDVFLLHNPEYFKFHAQKTAVSVEQINAEYYARIKNAFLYLEEEVLAGRISYYGVSSNTFGYHSTHPDATDINELLRMKTEANLKHFKVIQCPLNIFEPQALHSLEKSCIEIAFENNIAVLTNRPFNAIYNHRLHRLAEVEDQEEIALIEVDDCLEEGIFQEADIKAMLEELQVPEFVLNYFQLFSLLRDHFNDDLSFFDFKEHIATGYYPIITQLVNFMAEQRFELEVNEAFEEYIRMANLNIRLIVNYLSNKQNSKMDDIKNFIYSKHPDLLSCYRLTNILLRLYRSQVGVTSVLVGMRDELYVNSVIGELKEPTYKDAHKIWGDVTELQHVIY